MTEIFFIIFHRIPILSTHLIASTWQHLKPATTSPPYPLLHRIHRSFVLPSRPLGAIGVVHAQHYGVLVGGELFVTRTGSRVSHSSLPDVPPCIFPFVKSKYSLIRIIHVVMDGIESRCIRAGISSCWAPTGCRGLSWGVGNAVSTSGASSSVRDFGVNNSVLRGFKRARHDSGDASYVLG